jgi:hypothetical protein
MTILVNDINSSTVINDRKNIIKSIYPICPKCKENILFEIKYYKINLFGCKNGHTFKNILINEYEKTQEIDLLTIECDACKIKKYNVYNYEMYKCNKCNKNLCIKCNQNHVHKTINYDFKNFICNRHDEIYIYYCNTCNKNICSRCEKDHTNHNIITYGSILTNKHELKYKLKEYKNIIDIFNNELNNIANILNNVKKNIDILYNIYDDMINKTNDMYRNYETILCINNMDNDNIIK